MHIEIYTYIYAYLHIWACLKIWTGYCFLPLKTAIWRYTTLSITPMYVCMYVCMFVCLHVCMHACIDRSWSGNPDGIMDRIMSSMWFNVCGGFGSHWPHKLQTVSKVCSTLTSSSCSRTCCSRVRIISWGATSTAEECYKYSWRIILACVKLDSNGVKATGRLQKRTK
jgi:hypothetical protein